MLGDEGSNSRERTAGLTMRQAVADCAHPSTNIGDGNEALQFVMSGLMKKVAEPHHAGGLPAKIESQAGRGAAKDAHDRVQLPATTLQVRVGDGEVGGIGGDHPCEEQTTVEIPKMMAFQDRRWRNRRGQNDRRGRCFWQRPFGYQSLRERSRAKRGGKQNWQYPKL
jgi:hypothetical protein